MMVLRLVGLIQHWHGDLVVMDQLVLFITLSQVFRGHLIFSEKCCDLADAESDGIIRKV